MQPPRDKWWHEVIAGQAEDCEPTWVNAEHPLFILYTSGSTGKPKGVQHSTGGYLLQAHGHHAMGVRLQADDVFWCTADVGWVTGHTYITYGPLAVGATEVMFEGIPTYPDAGRFWKLIQDHKVSVFYTAPTAIRSLIKAGRRPAEEIRPQHRCAFSAPSASRSIPKHGCGTTRWSADSRCPIVDTWWQTETGGHMISPLPGAMPTKPGSCTFPLPGIMAAIVDETGQDVERAKAASW